MFSCFNITNVNKAQKISAIVPIFEESKDVNNEFAHDKKIKRFDKNEINVNEIIKTIPNYLEYFSPIKEYAFLENNRNFIIYNNEYEDNKLQKIKYKFDKNTIHTNQIFSANFLNLACAFQLLTNNSLIIIENYNKILMQNIMTLKSNPTAIIITDFSSILTSKDIFKTEYLLAIDEYNGFLSLDLKLLIYLVKKEKNKISSLELILLNHNILYADMFPQLEEINAEYAKGLLDKYNTFNSLYLFLLTKNNSIDKWNTYYLASLFIYYIPHTSLKTNNLLLPLLYIFNPNFSAISPLLFFTEEIINVMGNQFSYPEKYYYNICT
jgi:hypothetical protein